MHLGLWFPHGCACMWNEVADESCDIGPMPALRVQTRLLGLCCLYSPGFAVSYGKPKGSKRGKYTQLNIKKQQISDFHIDLPPCTNSSRSEIW